MKKKLIIFSIASFFCIAVHAQEKSEKLYQRDSALPMNKQYKGEIKDLHPSEQQKNQIKTLPKSVIQKKAANNNKVLTGQQKKQKLKQSHNQRKEKLNLIVTPEQKAKLKEKHQLKRGVTNMPNERTGN